MFGLNASFETSIVQNKNERYYFDKLFLKPCLDLKMFISITRLYLQQIKFNYISGSSNYYLIYQIINYL